MFRTSTVASLGARTWAFLSWLPLVAIVISTERYLERECKPLGVLERDTQSVAEWKRRLEADRARLVALRAIWQPIRADRSADDAPYGTGVFITACVAAEVAYLYALPALLTKAWAFVQSVVAVVA